MDELRKILTVEENELLLIIAPRGDAMSFKDSDVKSEFNSAIAKIENSPGKNLLIDFSNHNYYGSIIIGSMIRMASLVKDRLGKVAISGVSDDMQAVLKAMNLQKMWIEFEDRDEALRWLNA